MSDDTNTIHMTTLGAAQALNLTADELLARADELGLERKPGPGVRLFTEASVRAAKAKLKRKRS